MNSMQSVSPLRTSPLVPITAVSCCRGDVQVSRVGVWKTVNSELSHLQICNWNSYRKHVTAVQRQHIRKTKFLVNATVEFADNGCNPEVFRDQTKGKSLGATPTVIYKFSKVYTQIRTIGSGLKTSSFSKSPLVPTAVSCSRGDRQVSRVDEWKTVNSKLNPLRIDKLNGYNKHATKIQGRKTKLLANAASEFSDGARNPDVFHPQVNGKSLGATLDVIYKYSRAYTLRGTVLSIISVSLLAIQSLSDFTPSFFLGILQAVVGGCLANLYVVGINQLSDIEIDKVNKPYLPLASGELPVGTAILLTSLYAFLGFCVAWSAQSWPLRLGIFLWYAFGTAYSANIPLLRWKRIPTLAAMCLWSVQGAIIPILFHLHAQTCIKGRTLLLSKHAIFVSGIMSIYGIVIALFKDVPDVEGDRINGINSFAVQFGKKHVFWVSIWLLEMVCGIAIITGLSSSRIWIRSIMVISHSILGFILWRKANLVDLKSDEAIESLYLFIWKLYYAEYLLVPILRF